MIVQNIFISFDPEIHCDYVLLNERFPIYMIGLKQCKNRCILVFIFDMLENLITFDSLWSIAFSRKIIFIIYSTT